MNDDDHAWMKHTDLRCMDVCVHVYKHICTYTNLFVVDRSKNVQNHEPYVGT